MGMFRTEIQLTATHKRKKVKDTKICSFLKKLQKYSKMATLQNKILFFIITLCESLCILYYTFLITTYLKSPIKDFNINLTYY